MIYECHRLLVHRSPYRKPDAGYRFFAVSRAFYTTSVQRRMERERERERGGEDKAMVEGERNGTTKSMKADEGEEGLTQRLSAYP